MARKGYPSEKQDQYMLRLPDGMRDRIKAASSDNNRSMNAEIISILQKHIEGTGVELPEDLEFRLLGISEVRQRSFGALVTEAVRAYFGYATQVDRPPLVLSLLPPIADELEDLLSSVDSVLTLNGEFVAFLKDKYHDLLWQYEGADLLDEIAMQSSDLIDSDLSKEAKTALANSIYSKTSLLHGLLASTATKRILKTPDDQ